MTFKIDVRAELHTLQGHLRNNRIIDAFELVKAMNKQMDDEYYTCKKCGTSSCDCIPF